MRLHLVCAALLIGCASAAPAAPATDALFGTWTISGMSLAPITAVPADEAAARRGRKVVIQRTTVNFAGTVCEKPRFTTAPVQDETRIEVACENSAIIPNFYIGHTGAVTARLDGIIYSLTKS